jgi:putative addiction module component (TIGR02574 family)
MPNPDDSTGPIWDSIPDDAPFVPPEWHLHELARRRAAAEADPGTGESWEAVYARLSKRPHHP